MSTLPQLSAGGQPFQFNFEGHDVRPFVGKNGEPWLVAADVCKPLGIANVRDAYARLDDDEKGVALIDTPGGRQQMVIVNESGLYALIFHSRKPQAQRFKKWVTSEVLPAIRKTGSYSVQSASPLQQLKAMVAFMEQTDAKFAELHEKQAEIAMQVESVVERLDSADYFTVLQFCQRQGVKHTVSLRQAWGRRAAELSRERGIEIGEAIEGRYNVHRYHKSILLAVCVVAPKTGGQPPLLDEE